MPGNFHGAVSFIRQGKRFSLDREQMEQTNKSLCVNRVDKYKM